MKEKGSGRVESGYHPANRKRISARLSHVNRMQEAAFAGCSLREEKGKGEIRITDRS